MIIGICGKSCSGKSTLSKQILNYYKDKAIYIEIDKIGHKVLTMDKIKNDIINTFGTSITTYNEIDRKKLGKIVFNNNEEMNKLADCTWNAMEIEIDKLIDKNKDKIIILDWILLLKSKYYNECNIKILLDIPYDMRKKRATKRDNITEEAFDLREKASINYNHNDFDYIITSNDINDIKRMVMSL